MLIPIFLLIIFFLLAPRIIEWVSGLSKTNEEKRKEKLDADLKQKKREDEGFIITAGRIILGDKTFDKPKISQPQKSGESYLAYVDGEDSRTQSEIDSWYTKYNITNPNKKGKTAKTGDKIADKIISITKNAKRKRFGK